jgi:hypothetical protein
MGAWMDGWTDGWTDGCTDGQMNKYYHCLINLIDV